MEDTLLDTRQVARRLSISRSYVYRLVRAGALPAVRIGRAVRVRPRDLDRYLQQRLAHALPALTDRTPWQIP